MNNLLAGHQSTLEFPVEASFLLAGDYRFTDVDSQNNVGVLSAGMKWGLKNDLDRGIAAGFGMDWFIGEYWRYSLLLDLDFLFHMTTDIGDGKRFGGSFLSKWMLSSVISEKRIKEYYLRVNFIQVHVSNFTVSMSLNRGIFRRKYPPYFGDQGLMYSLAYTFRK